MPEIVVISLAEDEARARKVVEALHSNGLEFWWEQGAPKTDTTRSSVMAARCVVFIWTTTSSRNAAFVTLATKVYKADKAIGVKLDKLRLNLALANMTEIDLTSFKGSKGDLFLLDLLAAAKAKAAGIDPPPARGPISRVIKRLGLLTPLALLILGVGANIEQFKSYFRWPTADEKKIISEIKTGDCKALRTYVAKYSDGFYTDSAQKLIDAADPKGASEWVKESGDLELYIGGDDMPRSASEADAKKLFTDKLQAESEAKCGSYTKGVPSRNMTISYAPTTEQPACDRDSNGYFCWAKPTVTCTYEVEKFVETCGKLKA